MTGGKYSTAYFMLVRALLLLPLTYKHSIMKTLVVPTDFSPASINAVNYAADMALAIKADLHLVHMYQLPVSVAETPLPLQSIDELKEGAESRLKGLAEDLQHITSGKLNITSEARFGLVVDELDELCNELNPFAIIMGTTSTSGIERMLFGNMTIAAAKNLTYPVICIPKGTEYGKGIHKIGLATDLEEVEETIPFEMISNFVKEFDAELHVLNIETVHREEPVAEALEQTAILGTAIRELNPQFHFISGDDIEGSIEEFSEKHNLDLIIMVPRKHGITDKLFSKSSTKRLLRESHIPVMAVHE
jgi:nucleotide-binding universal stress UspA family protein